MRTLTVVEDMVLYPVVLDCIRAKRTSRKVATTLLRSLASAEPHTRTAAIYHALAAFYPAALAAAFANVGTPNLSLRREDLRLLAWSSALRPRARS